MPVLSFSLYATLFHSPALLIYSFKGYRNFDKKYATMGYILPYLIIKYDILIEGN